ncbi:MAG: SGNH/GDSL hydrolase family protein [Myxococcales bacterium]|nr:SGNH/GDSL hydrolase family protein [Myxococcales bacterium]
MRSLWVAGAILVALGCGGADGDPGGSGAAGPGSSNSSSGAGAGGSGGEAASSGAGAGGASSSSGAGGAGGEGTASGGAGSGGSPAPEGLPDVGSLVVLGDSISDGGGQGPYYYNLLRSSLETFYGKTLSYSRKAQSGSKTSALVGQVNSLPGSLPGPVVVTITSGGNDMKDNLVAILAGLDGPARQQMGSNIASALDALLAPGRFGAGVEVHVFYANIYDASDGQGNYASGGCTINIDSPGSTDPYFDNWNGEIALRLGTAGQVLADMHMHFDGHGFNHPPKWYANDCTHPNTTGHAQVEAMFYELITGATL